MDASVGMVVVVVALRPKVNGPVLVLLMRAKQIIYKHIFSRFFRSEPQQANASESFPTDAQTDAIESFPSCRCRYTSFTYALNHD